MKSEKDNLPIQLAGRKATSLVDGLGVNYVIYLQGCSHAPKCQGCHNPSTHSSKGGIASTINDVFKMVSAKRLPSGVTFSGGEPLDQYEAVVALAKMFKLRGYRTTLYTGYKIDDPECCYDLSAFDYVVDGKFCEDQKDLTFNLKGSKNQRILKAASNFPGLFTDIHSGTHLRQYIYAAQNISEENILW